MKQNNTAASQLWVYNPWLDLIVGCGAWSGPLLLFAYFTATPNVLIWSVGFYALALFFNYPHYMATIYRAYHRAEDVRKYRIFTVHITAIVALTLLLSHFWFRALPLIFTLYLTWSPWHYSGQNYGLFMMFARRAGAKPTTAEKRALYAAFLISYVILFLSFHTGSSNDPLFLSLGIPGRPASFVASALAVAFVALSIFGLARLQEQTGWRPLLPALTLFSTQFVWFLLPTMLSMGEGMRIPQSRYSTGVLAVMHSAQYLWITSYYARREADAEGVSRWRPFGYFAILVAGGIALFVPGPWLASHVFHYDFTASFLIFTALVNIHHFILDGAIWKLRDGRIAALLLNSQERLSHAATETTSRVGAGLRWIVGSSSAVRALRVSAAVTLLAWGTVDQVRYYFALQNDDLKDLQRAAALGSYDTSLEMRLARKDLEAGNPEGAVAAWKQAIRANASDPAPRHALLKYLIEQNRFQEAYDLTNDSLKHLPKDSNLLVDRGILAAQLNHPEDALQSWKNAISVDHAQMNAYLYLAGELQRESKPSEAIPYYISFLEVVSKASLNDRPPARTIIVAALKLAECQMQTSHLEPALKAYQLAAKIAAETNETKLESLASIDEAALQASMGNVSGALHLYQHALKLDATSGDRHAEAADWYAYAMFLRDAKFPSRLAYACLLKSESLMKSQNAPELQTVSQARLDAEKNMESKQRKASALQPAELRHNLQPAIEEALSLTR